MDSALPNASKAFEIYLANCNRLIALANIVLPAIVANTTRFNEASSSAITRLRELSANLKANAEPNPQAVIDQVTVDLTTSDWIVKDVLSIVDSQAFLFSWMIVMLVTFAEAYLEDALRALVLDPPSNTSPQNNTGSRLSKKAIKKILGSRDPRQWIKRLEAFGAIGYSDDLGVGLWSIWRRRHRIVHSPTADALKATPEELVNAMKVLGTFVETTDLFVRQRSSVTTTI